VALIIGALFLSRLHEKRGPHEPRTNIISMQWIVEPLWLVSIPWVALPNRWPVPQAHDHLAAVLPGKEHSLYSKTLSKKTGAVSAPVPCLPQEGGAHA
jgi:hypothetical protein